MSTAEVIHLIAAYGGWVVAAMVALESMGVPAPGEATLINAAVWAGATHHLGILTVVMAGAAGAIVGDNLGFLIGRTFGARWLVRHGTAIHMTARRVELGRYLFQEHGAAVVFFGRFVAILRTLAALLAGSNRMGWSRFLRWNAAGGIVWAAVYGFGGYAFGRELERVAGPFAVVLVAASVALVFAASLYVHRHEQELEDRAARELARRHAHR